MKKIIFLALVLSFICIDLVKAQTNTFYEETNQKSRKPIPYQYVRENDVIWRYRVWRDIDLKQKFNHFFYYPIQPTQGRVSFMTMLNQAVMEGTIPAYSDDDCTKPYSIEEVERALTKSTYQPLLDEYGEEIGDTLMSSPIPLDDIKAIRIKEDWFIDKQRSVQDVRVLSISPVLYEMKGGALGYRILYWVKFEDCRPIFVQNEAYNVLNNDVQRLSYDDVFMKRMFSSYIIKETNVSERYIEDFSEGLEALLESENIKNKVFEKEQEMWEF